MGFLVLHTHNIADFSLYVSSNTYVIVQQQYFVLVLLFADCQLNTSKYQSLQAGRSRGERLETRKTPQANYILGVCSHVQGGRIQYEDKFVPPWLTRHCVNITQEVFELARPLLRNKRFVLNEMFQ